MKLYYWCREAVRSIGLRLILVLAGYVLLSMLAIALTDAWMGALARQNAYLTNSHETITLVNELRTRLHEAESAQRGYLISLQNKYVPVDEKAIEPQVDSVQKTMRALEKHMGSGVPTWRAFRWGGRRCEFGFHLIAPLICMAKAQPLKVLRFL